VTPESCEQRLMPDVRDAIADIGYAAVGNAAAALGDLGVYRCMLLVIDLRVGSRRRIQCLKSWNLYCLLGTDTAAALALAMEHRLFRGRS